MLQALFILIALLAGAATALQTGVNSQLRFNLNNPLQAAFVSFAVGTIALAIIALPQGTRWNLAEMSGFSWWVWTGGLLGVYFVISAIYLVPRFGAATYLVLNIAGQMITALILDHYGLLGFPVQRISFLRVVGAFFLLVGVVLIRRF